MEIKYKNTISPPTGFPNYIVDTEIKHFINIIDNTLNHKLRINLYYQNQFHNNSKIDEHILKTLCKKGDLLTDPTKKIRHDLLQQI